MIPAPILKSGFDRLDAVRAKYGNEPWFKHAHGNFTFFMLELPESEVRERGPRGLRACRSTTLRCRYRAACGLGSCGYWGGDDLDAPSARIGPASLHTLAALDKPIDIAIFPRAEHGIFEYETGRRRNAPLDAQFGGLLCDDARLHPGKAGAARVRIFFFLSILDVSSSR